MNLKPKPKPEPEPKRPSVFWEFIMTYGWAILVVLVVMGALAYFGVLSPVRESSENMSTEEIVLMEDLETNETWAFNYANISDYGIRLNDESDMFIIVDCEITDLDAYNNITIKLNLGNKSTTIDITEHCKELKNG